MHADFFLITTEVPSWIIVIAAIAIFIFASGAVYNIGDRFRRTKWVLKNNLTHTIWVTTHRFSPRELRVMMKQRGWNSEIVGRAEH
jgi:hypothetical protein